MQLCCVSIANTTDGCDSATDACWTTVHVESPTPVHTLDLELQQSIAARFLRVLHVLQTGANAPPQPTAQIWEVRVWSVNGPSGPLPSDTSAPHRELERVPVQAMLGVNSIWGWFSGAYSDWSDRWGINERASTFGGVGPSGIANEGRALFAHARNYHNLNCKFLPQGTHQVLPLHIVHGTHKLVLFLSCIFRGCIEPD